MALYKATKNLVFKSLGKGVIVDEVIDLEPAYAEKVNKDLKLTFPDVDAVLVPVGDAVEADEPAKDEKPKRTRKAKTDNETEPVEDAAE